MGKFIEILPTVIDTHSDEEKCVDFDKMLINTSLIKYVTHPEGTKVVKYGIDERLFGVFGISDIIPSEPLFDIDYSHYGVIYQFCESQEDAETLYYNTVKFLQG